MENWNSADTVVFHGKDYQLTGADREHAEVSMLAPHLRQSAMVHINTLLLQAVRPRRAARAGSMEWSFLSAEALTAALRAGEVTSPGLPATAIPASRPLRACRWACSSSVRCSRTAPLLRLAELLEQKIGGFQAPK